MFYDRSRCRHYAECVRGLPQVFDPTRRPWIRADLADADTVAEVVRRCPTGALHYRLLAEEPEAPTRPTIITPEPRGPLLVRGDLVLDTPEGPLPETRAALCACGRTKNQPRKLSTSVRQVDQGLVVPGVSSLGLLIHAAVGSWGGIGGLRTNRSGWAASAASSTVARWAWTSSARP